LAGGWVSDSSSFRAVELTKAVLSELPGGSLASFVIDALPSVQRANAERVVLQIVELLGEDESELLRRLRGDPALFRLVADAVYAAARADSDAKLRGLARAASLGVRDSALVDQARYLVGVIAQLDVIHVRLLVALEAVADRDPKENPKVVDLLGVSEGIAQGLSAELLRLALAEAAGLVFGGLHNQVRLSPFGREVLRFLRDQDWDLDKYPAP
jgi:hypothetical protein